MSDVLSITVPIGAKYASVNSVGANGHRAGKKSPEYKALFADVKAAAETEIKWLGWDKAECECLAMIVRYVADRRRHDAMNLGKCEWDALTEAGVWLDDSLANPCLPMIRYCAPHRVTIVVVKLYESVLKPAQARDDAVSGSRTSRSPKSAQAGIEHLMPCKHGRPCGLYCRGCERHALNTWKPGSPIPQGYALLNGKLVTREVALQKAGVK